MIKNGRSINAQKLRTLTSADINSIFNTTTNKYKASVCGILALLQVQLLLCNSNKIHISEIGVVSFEEDKVTIHLDEKLHKALSGELTLQEYSKLFVGVL